MIENGTAPPSAARTGAVFETPWKLRVNPHLDEARSEAIAWMMNFGLLHDQESIDTFIDWRLAEVASWFFPDAEAGDCCVAVEMMGWYFLPFDDQLDTGAGRDPHRVARVVGALISIVHGEGVPRSTSSRTIVAFADLWRRMTGGISASLLARLRYHWSSYFSSQLTEAVDRVTGYKYCDIEDYLAFRTATTCAFGQNDLAERWGGAEVPATLWHHPALARIRRLGADLVAIRNDSLSTPHEDIDGVHNVIHIIERTRECTRSEAVAYASELAQDKVDQLVCTETVSLPKLLTHLNSEHQAAVQGHADIIHNWIVGDYEWERASTRNQRHRRTPGWATGLLFPEGG